MEVSVSGAQLNASKGSLASLAVGNVYSIALVHNYAFLDFDIQEQHDRVVSAVVYSKQQTPLDLEVVSLFMDMSVEGRSAIGSASLQTNNYNA